MNESGQASKKSKWPLVCRWVQFVLQRLPKCYASDWLYNQALFYSTFNRFFSMRRPTTFNEKLQVLKLRQRSDAALSTLVDKFAVRQFVADRVGEEYLIPLIGCWNLPAEIPWDELPAEFVLKVAHGTGYNIIVEDSRNLNREEAVEQLKQWQTTNYYHISREPPYRSVPPRIICESVLKDDSEQGLMDYKFFCFHGEPAIVQVNVDRFGTHRMNYYNMEWELQEFRRTYPVSEIEIPRPENFSKMAEIARELSKNMPFARIDLYEANGRVYFGEITLYPAGGWGKFEPEKYDTTFGNMIRLDQHDQPLDS